MLRIINTDLLKFKGGIDREGGAAGGKMLRTLFSRMLAAYLSVIIIVLIALGFMASSIFHDHYIEKIKSELVREADAICRIVLEEYMDDAKRPVAKEKLFAIVRQYEALLQLCFIDPSLGIRSFYDEKNASKWQASEEFDVETLAKNIVSQTNFEYGYAYDLLDGYTTVRTLTVTCPISTAENITVGALMLHYDMDGIYASLNKLYIDVFAAVAGAVLITIPIAFIISKYITKPVSQINDAVTAFSRGNYDSRVKVGRMDELGELGISFNDMADKVSELEKCGAILLQTYLMSCGRRFHQFAAFSKQWRMARFRRTNMKNISKSFLMRPVGCPEWSMICLILPELNPVNTSLICQFST